MVASKRPYGLPDAVTVGGHKIKVVLDRTLYDRGDAYGQWLPQKETILIDPSYGHDLAWETICHEVLEAINDYTEMNMPHDQIQTLGLLIHQAFADIMRDQ